MHIAHCTLHIAHCTLHITQCTLHITHCTLHITHYTLHITHYTLHITHYTLHITHYTLHITHYTLHTAHCTLHTAHCTLHTAHCTLHTAHCALRTAHCALRTAHCTLHTAHCTLHTAHCTLHTAHCTLHTAHCTLHTAHCTLHTAHCTLHTAHCTLHTAHCTLHITHYTAIVQFEASAKPARQFSYVVQIYHDRFVTSLIQHYFCVNNVFPFFCPEPSTGPTNITFPRVTSFSILVTWSQPAKQDRNGVIQHYGVCYQSWHDKKPCINYTTTDDTSFELSGLKPHQPIKFAIKAATMVGYGPATITGRRTAETGIEYVISFFISN